MAITYLEVTNILLREVNEVPMSEQQFINSRGLQQFAKQAINRAYIEIVNSSKEWPWLREKSNVPVSNIITNVIAGQGTVDIDTALYNEISWETFYLTDKDLLVNDPLVQREVSKNLIHIPYDEWITKYRERDLRDDTEGNIPLYVFMYPDKDTFGISPVPDADYSIQYDAWKNPDFLDLPTDTLPFPDRWYTVLVAKARYYMWLFRENDKQASFAKGDYTLGIQQMKLALLSQQVIRMRAS
jgi:hypothetical protein